jgi:hypothetical protein
MIVTSIARIAPIDTLNLVEFADFPHFFQPTGGTEISKGNTETD